MSVPSRSLISTLLSGCGGVDSGTFLNAEHTKEKREKPRSQKEQPVCYHLYHWGFRGLKGSGTLPFCIMSGPEIATKRCSSGSFFPIQRTIAFLPYLLDSEWIFGLLRQIHCLLLSFFPCLAHQPLTTSCLLLLFCATYPISVTLIIRTGCCVCLHVRYSCNNENPLERKLFDSLYMYDYASSLPHEMRLCCPDNILSVLVILGPTRERASHDLILKLSLGFRKMDSRKKQNDFLDFATV